MTIELTQADRDAEAAEWLEKQIAYITGLLAKADAETQHFEKLVEDGQECWASNARVWREYAREYRDKLSIYTTIRDTFIDRDEWRSQHENLLHIRQSELARHRQSAERGEVVAKLTEDMTLIRDMLSLYAGVQSRVGDAFKVADAALAYTLPTPPEAGA